MSRKGIIISAIAVVLVAAIAATGVILYKNGAFGGKKRDNGDEACKESVKAFMDAMITGDTGAMAQVLAVSYGKSDRSLKSSAESLVLDGTAVARNTFTYTVKSVKDVNSNALKIIADDYKKSYDIKIKNAKTVSVELTVKDNKYSDEYIETLSLTFVEQNGEWKFAGYDSGSSAADGTGNTVAGKGTIGGGSNKNADDNDYGPVIEF